MKLEIIVNQHYDMLSIGDKQLVKQIIRHKEHYKNYSCEELARECHISRATLLRLCRKIGLNSFSELKFLLREDNEKLNIYEDFDKICDNYRLMLNGLLKLDFTPLCEKIYNADTLYIYGTGNEQKNLAQELKRIFLTVGKCVIDLYDYGEIEFVRRNFREHDLFMIISLSGENKEGIQIIKNVRSFIQTVSLTRLENNTISSLCDLRLYATTKKLAGIQNDAYELVGVFYAILDLMLFRYIEYEKKVKIKENREENDGTGASH